jgi:UDP-glucose 6-dehydrogenase
MSGATNVVPFAWGGSIFSVGGNDLYAGSIPSNQLLMGYARLWMGAIPTLPVDLAELWYQQGRIPIATTIIKKTTTSVDFQVHWTGEKMTQVYKRTTVATSHDGFGGSRVRMNAIIHVNNQQIGRAHV